MKLNLQKLGTLMKTHTKFGGKLCSFAILNKIQKYDRQTDQKQKTKFGDFGFGNQITKTS